MRSFKGRLVEPASRLVFAFLVIGAIVPTASILWGINEAAQREAASTRQDLVDAYRGQLQLLRGRIDSLWEARAALITARATADAPSAFRQIVTEGLADSVVVLDGRGAPVYPGPHDWRAVESGDGDLGTAWETAESLESARHWTRAAAAYARIVPSSPSLEAVAAQSQVRCLLRGGDTDAALQAIDRHFGGRAANRAIDANGRLVAADELLLALHLQHPGDPRARETFSRLSELLNNYERAPMASAQRLFLMDEAGALPGAPSPSVFPTYAAERLAATFLENDPLPNGSRVMERTRLKDVWRLTATGGRVVALYRTPTVLAMLRSVLDQPAGSSEVTFSALPPGSPVVEESVDAGNVLPDWRIAFRLPVRSGLSAHGRRRFVLYASAGAMVIALIAGTGLLLGRAVNRQTRVAQLKTDLVAAVSHELKTPLSSMQLLVEALLESPADPDRTRQYLQMIAGENLRLSGVIDNFLTFSRIERTADRFKFADARPSAIVAGAVAAMGERLKSPACDFTLHVDADVPAIHGDSVALTTALLNLLDNAHKYTEAPRRIELKTYVDRSQVVFAVHDNGIGIEPKDQERIFGQFYRVDQRLVDRSGCGLGLSIVELVARAHGGAVTVTSEVGVGSTFMLSVPATVPAAGALA